MQAKPTIDSHREISAALGFLRQASADDGAYDLDPRVVSGWVDMCLGSLDVLVKAKRGKHSDDKALEQTIETHLEHARDHMEDAYAVSYNDDDCVASGCGLDDDGLPEFDHATARVALLYSRKAIVENEKRSRLACDKIREIKERLNTEREKRAAKMEGVFWREIQKSILGDSVTKPRVVIGLDGADTYSVATVSNQEQAEEPFGKGSGLVELFKDKPKASFSFDATDAINRMERISNLADELYIKRRYPNSCKGDKIKRVCRYERFTRQSIDGYTLTSYSPAIFTRHRIETDNNPGKTTESCVGGPERQPIGVALGNAKKDGTVLVKLSSANSIGATAKRDVYAGECVTTNDVEFGVESVSGVDGGAWSPLIPMHISAPHAWQLSGQCHGCVFAKYSGGPGYDTVRCNGCKDKWNRPGYEAKQ